VAEIDYRPDAPRNLANPFPILARMREQDPCHWSPRLKSWVITRYDDVKRACFHADIYSSNRLQPFFAAMPSEESIKIGSLMRFLTQWMVFQDEPNHARLRKLTSKVFNQRSMQAMRPQIEAITQHLLQAMDDHIDKPGAELDFISAFAGPLPCLVIMAMLGVPKEDLDKVKKLSDDLALFIGSSREEGAKYESAEVATFEMAAYFRAQIKDRRINPRKDLLSDLILVQDMGERLNTDELIATCILLLFAGHETTTNHLANSLLALMQFPDQLEKLRSNPALAPKAIEELLRYDGPSSAQVRIVTVAHELHGNALNEGDRVFMMLNAANRDPQTFRDPNRLDIDRKGPPHLAFGFGIHLCLGFPLARMEGQIAIPAVLKKFKNIELASEPEWLNSLVFRGMKQLPISVTQA
jgi:cytochrome P450